MKTISEVENIIYSILKECFGFGDSEHEIIIATYACNKILSIVIGEEEKVIDGRGSITEVTIIRHPITIRDAIERVKK